MKRTNDFDGVSKIYDKLSTLVFGKSMSEAQTVFLPEIAQYVSVLILGGGTGWLLANVLKTNLKGKVWYVEASLKMIELSKRKIPTVEMSRVFFIHGTEHSIPAEIAFDVVITPFFLDLFTNNHCQVVVQKITSCLHSKSIWVVTDFINLAWWHNGMLFMMYKFFKLTSNIEASKLPEWESILKRHGLIEMRSHLFYKGFIKGALVTFHG